MKLGDRFKKKKQKGKNSSIATNNNKEDTHKNFYIIKEQPQREEQIDI